MNKSKLFTKEYILSVPKVINNNGCWIPISKRPRTDGYINVSAEYVSYYFHRVVLCIYYDISYDNYEIETRHSKNCSRACFNPEHIKPGSRIDNMKDFVEHHSDEKCPKCGGSFSSTKVLRDLTTVRVTRVCKGCARLYKMKWAAKKSKMAE